MDACIFCGKLTSFKFDGNGEYQGKNICPKCQKEKLGTNFNTGCSGGDICSIHHNEKKQKK